MWLDIWHLHLDQGIGFWWKLFHVSYWEKDSGDDRFFSDKLLNFHTQAFLLLSSDEIVWRKQQVALICGAMVSVIQLPYEAGFF